MQGGGVGTAGSPTAPRVRVFGPVVAELGGQVAVPSPAGAQLIGLLAVRGRMRRDQVAFTLWPDRPEDRARRTLSDTIYRLRALTGDADPLVVADGDWVALADDVTVDLAEFVRLVDGDATACLAAADVATAPLLADVDAEWADVAREHVRRLRSQAGARAWAALDAAGHHDAALTAAERWFDADPLDEAAHRAAMHSLARAGRPARALQHYDELVAMLASEVAVDPAPETVALAEQLRGEAQATGPAGAGVLVGRTAERARLVAGIDAAIAGRGGLAIVLGEPGMGKTRLLDAVAAAASWRGATVGRATADDTDGAVLTSAVGELVPPARLDQLADLGDPVWVAMWRAAQAPAAGSATTRPAERAAMIRGLLGAAARTGPQVLVLDDVHAADDETWALLDDLLPELADLPVAVVAAARDAELRGNRERWGRVTAWDRTGAPVVALAPLDDAAITEILTGAGTAPDTIDAAVALAGGNPFVALSRAATSDPAGDVWRERLGRLDPTTLAVGRLAAVLGRRFDYRDLRGDDPAAAAQALGVLERHGIVETTPIGHHFVHDLWRTALLADVPDMVRADLHALALERLADSGDASAARLLVHADAAGRADRIGPLAARAGHDALARGNATEAAHLLRRALATIGDDEHTRFAVLADLTAATSVLAEPGEHTAAVTELRACAAGLSGWADVEAQRYAGLHALQTGRFAEAVELAEAARHVADRVGDGSPAWTLTVAGLHSISASALREVGDAAGSASQCAAALAAYRDADAPYGVAAMTDLAGGLAWRRGDYAEAARSHGAAAAAFAELGLPLPRARALNNLGSAQWGAGDYRGAEASHTAALELCRALGDRRAEGDNVDNLGGVAWALGDDAAAVGHYSQALAIRRATDDPWGVSISLSNLGDVYRGLGRPEQAIEHYDESLAVNAAAGVVRNDATTRMSRGVALLDAGRVADAVAELDTACNLLDDLDDRPNLIEATAGLARARHDAGDLPGAEAALARLAELVRPDDRSELRQLAALTAGELATEPAAIDAHAAAAWAAMQAALADVTPEFRQQVATERVLHRRTHRLYLARARYVTVTLASGHPLDVTVHAPGDPPGRDGRLVAIGRICDEALAAGSTIGDEALAAALGVSRRTVLRDMEVLRATGADLVTTGRPGDR
ncbi:MAG TPA: tetratricopeptide repeat protein [Ilumatobacter sp.]|nr:tetratricopeptide repeat protein [Ilumatobacter sp.]